MTDNNQNAVFTIGHSDHRIERFLVLLAQNQIDAVADVRSSPQSRFHPHFNRAELSDCLRAAGIYYVYLGNELGARRIENYCYVDGKARYDLIARTTLFQDGIKRLVDGSRRFRIALMCAEKDPITCHRTILVCRHLHKLQISTTHILYDGNLENQSSLEERLLKLVGVSSEDLLSSRTEAIEHAYDIQSDKIAFVRNQVFKEEQS